MFDQRGAALDPIAGIVIHNRPDLLDCRGVDVAAHDAIGAMQPGVMCHRFLEISDETHGGFDPALGERAQ